MEDMIEESPLEETLAVKTRVENLLEHINNVRKGTRRVGMKFIQMGEVDFGKDLIARGFRHDQSKWYGIEWEYLLDTDLSDQESELAAAHHVRVNDHHPEFWGGVHNMPKICVAEMVCDWYGRSIEFGDNLSSFFVERACPRYEIKSTDQVHAWIEEILELLLDKPFNKTPN